MYLWLSDLYKNPATEDSITKDRGVHNWFRNVTGKDENKRDLYEYNTKGMYVLAKKLYLNFDVKNEYADTKKWDDEILAKLKKDPQFKELYDILEQNEYLDKPLYQILNFDQTPLEGQNWYVIERPKDLTTIISVVPAKELQPGEGIDRPTYVPDYSISRSGVIPHGSTITLLGDLKKGKKYKKKEDDELGFLINGVPQFIDEDYSESKDINIRLSEGTWDKSHLALSDTMGTGISPTNDRRIKVKKKEQLHGTEQPFNLYNPPLPFIPTEGFNEVNDPGEEEVYTQQLFLHDLYPYSVRPDLRLNDVNKKLNIINHIKIEMFTKKDEGTQGGIINIPFVNKFVPTVNMKMNMWLETVIENGKEILQLQYEQIVFFEFGFGDGGGTTSWPHIQVNTLRQYKDLNKYSKLIANEQFIQPAQEALKRKVKKNQELVIPVSSGCPFGHK